MRWMSARYRDSSYEVTFFVTWVTKSVTSGECDPAVCFENKGSMAGTLTANIPAHTSCVSPFNL